MKKPSRWYQSTRESEEHIIFQCKEGRCCPPSVTVKVDGEDTVIVLTGWGGKSLNGLDTDADGNYEDKGELAAIDLRVYVKPVVPSVPYVYTLEERVEQLDQACRQHIDSKAHWTSAVMVSDKAKADKPKAKAVEAWANACWVQFYTNEATLTADLDLWDETMLTYPDCPHSMKEVMQEV